MNETVKENNMGKYNKDVQLKASKKYKYKSEENRKKVNKWWHDSRKRRVERLRQEGVINAWSVVVKGKEPKYGTTNALKGEDK